jgi:hypothetical protein
MIKAQINQRFHCFGDVIMTRASPANSIKTQILKNYKTESDKIDAKNAEGKP